jgi:hypothetical protein
MFGVAFGGLVGAARLFDDSGSPTAKVDTTQPASTPTATSTPPASGLVPPDSRAEVEATSATPQPPFTSPFEFCRHVDTIDWPVKQHPGGEAYTGPDTPFVDDRGNPLVWRCWAEIVLTCEPGASGGPCLKVDTRTEPTAELRTWCAENPGQAPPLAVTGHNNAYEWSCDGTEPRITRRLVEENRIDGLGYLIGPWEEEKE